MFLFHQNLRTFASSNDERNTEYGETLRRITGTLPEPIAVAGFTEVLSGDLFHICDSLDVQWRARIASRRTAVGQKYEYIGIGTKKDIEPIGWGRVVPIASFNGMTIQHDAVEPGHEAEWAKRMPDAAPPDYQSLVYIVVRLQFRPVAVGFLHNIYSVIDGRSIIMQRLPDAAELILARGVSAVYVCGDFNVKPHNRANHNITMYAYSTGSVRSRTIVNVNPGRRLLPAQEKAGAKPGGTLMSGEKYDYAFSTRSDLNAASAWIDTSTMDSRNGKPIGKMKGLMSDHVASMLWI